ncbi:ubiquinone biosynthesis protein COQ4 [Saccharomyces eubayanus]|uniref:ubiquinone biosynthesis protein COQ4 n=1 Tax=Saccharomyces eubayanus TaxID=1080349 RepID=UPI0006C1B104|nr:COQ4-like protein [Saccharomyces eubayanus]KOH01043.1 COQ4-like protein [Saccharomyces eubayanus]
MLGRSMLGSTAARSVRCQRRGIFLPTAAIYSLGSLVFGKEARLADAMERGDLHNKNVDYAKEAEERTESRIMALANSRPMKPRYEGHVPLYRYEKLLLFAISGWNSFFHPEDGYNIVQLGEATALPVFLENLKQTMLSDPSGRRILKEQPNITADILHMDKLAKLPHNTFGYVYYQWLKRENVSPDTRAPVKFIDDPMHAYIFKRYRQCHDFYHALNNLPIIIEGEVTIKALEGANLGVPMAILGGILAPLRLKKAQRERLYNTYLPWAIRTGLSCKPLINVYWEEMLEKDVDALRKELQITPPPDLRAMRKKRAALKKELDVKYNTHV